MTSNLKGIDITFPAIVLEKLNRTNRYDALRSISMFYTVTPGTAACDTLQAPIPHISVYYICIHKLIITTADNLSLNSVCNSHFQIIIIRIYYSVLDNIHYTIM